MESQRSAAPRFLQTCSRRLPTTPIIAKKKHGSGLPFGLWLAKDNRLRQLATGSLESMRDRGILRSAFINELLGTLLAEHSMFYGEPAWVTITLDQWLDAHRPGYRAR